MWRWPSSRLLKKIRRARAAATDHPALPENLSLVQYFFAAALAKCAQPRPADDRLEIYVEIDRINDQKFGVGHGLVRLELSVSAARGIPAELDGAPPSLGMRMDAQRPSGLRVYERGGDLAEVHHTHGPPADGAARGDRNSIRGAAIGLHEHEHPLVILRKLNLQAPPS